MSDPVQDIENEKKCSRCGKNHYPTDNTPIGTNIGNSGDLATAILKTHYNNIAQKAHPLSEPGGKKHTAQAHHLITSECMEKDEEWEEICNNYGYNINHWRNGIVLPRAMRIACELKIPLHYGNHEDTYLVDTWMNYVDVVKSQLKPIKAKARKKDYCDKPEENIIKDLNRLSKDIWKEVKKFNLKLTFDGKDYKSKQVGCKGHSVLKQKKKGGLGSVKCINRVHDDITLLDGHKKRMLKAQTSSKFFIEQEKNT